MPAPYPTGSTVLSVLVPEAEPLVGQLRRVHDPSAPCGMPAHVTILYPWLPLDVLTDDDLAALGRVARRVEPFAARLARAGRFPGTLWLEPTPVEAFRSLTRAVWDGWPTCPPYEGAYDDVQPHLTVAYGSPDDVLDEVEATVAPGLPVGFEVRAISLHAFDGTAWVERHTVPLG